ncbi:MAG: CvpA family protein [Hyphomicrobiaceae bacterium]|nr:CvpA family protein [Hyphomicrobiaceae bacterium]
MIGPLTYLDIGVIAVSAISGLLALYRGLTRELLAILSWMIAGVAVLYFVLNHRKFAEEVAVQMGGVQVVIAQAAVGIVIFLVVLIFVHLITARISDTILDSNIGMIDRIAGLFFGLVRGFVIVVIPFMLALSFFPDDAQHPDWVKNARSKPYLQSTGEALRGLLVAYVVPLIDKATNKEQPQDGAGVVPKVHAQGLAFLQPFHICVTDKLVSLQAARGCHGSS